MNVSDYDFFGSYNIEGVLERIFARLEMIQQSLMDLQVSFKEMSDAINAIKPIIFRLMEILEHHINDHQLMGNAFVFNGNMGQYVAG